MTEAELDLIIDELIEYYSNLTPEEELKFQQAVKEAKQLSETVA